MARGLWTHSKLSPTGHQNSGSSLPSTARSRQILAAHRTRGKSPRTMQPEVLDRCIQFRLNALQCCSFEQPSVQAAVIARDDELRSNPRAGWAQPSNNASTFGAGLRPNALPFDPTMVDTQFVPGQTVYPAWTAIGIVEATHRCAPAYGVEPSQAWVDGPSPSTTNPRASSRIPSQCKPTAH